MQNIAILSIWQPYNSVNLCNPARKGGTFSVGSKIGEGFREWSEAPSYEEGVGVDGGAEGLPSDGVWGYPPARSIASLCGAEDWRYLQREGKDGVGRGVKSLLRGVLSEKNT